MSQAFRVEIELVPLQCGVCGVWFGLNAAAYKSARTDATEFFCTAGHSLCWKETAAQRLTRELSKKDQQLAAALDMAKRHRASAEAAERSARAAKGQVTRLKNRLAKGECPCCGVVFADLVEHMKQNHPDFEQREEPADEQQ